MRWLKGIRFVGPAMGITLFMVLQMTVGCTALQQQQIKDGFVSAAECSMLSAIGCAAQSMGACPPPLTVWGGAEWGDYGDCLVERSASCSTTALARCAYRSIADAIDGPVVAGGVGCSGPQEQEAIKACVRDSTVESEEEAIQAVAWCQKKVCMRLED